MRKVLILTTTTQNLTTIESNDSATYGELASAMEAAGVSLEDKKVVYVDASGNRGTFGLAETVLPSGDLRIYLYPGKVKSGEVIYSAATVQEVKTKVNKILDAVIEELGGTPVTAEADSVKSDMLDEAAAISESFNG